MTPPTRPSGWFPADVTLADGSRAHIRPLGPADARILAAGFERLSPSSRELRFFTPTPHLSAEVLRSLTDVDQHEHLALLAVRAERPSEGLGVARAIRDPDHPSHAEIAVTVLDEFHRRGIGTALLRALRRAALADGIDTFDGYVLAQNRPALEWLRHSRARIGHDGGGLLHFAIPLRPGTPPGRVHREAS
jgi:GNAT superfamily N-acetyltransferase